MTTPTHAELREKAARVNSTQGAWIAISGADILVILDELDADKRSLKIMTAGFEEQSALLHRIAEALGFPRIDRTEGVKLDEEVTVLTARIAALEAQVAASAQVIQGVIRAFSIGDTPEHRHAVAVLENSLNAIKALREKAPKGAAGVK